MSDASTRSTGVLIVALLAALSVAGCKTPRPTSPSASRQSEALSRGDVGSPEAKQSARGNEAGAREARPSDAERLEEFKQRCLRKFDRIEVTNLLRPYEGLQVTIKIELDRSGDDEYTIEYTIKEGTASIATTEGTSTVGLAGRLSCQMSREKDRIVGTVQLIDITVMMGEIELARRSICRGFEGECPLELTRCKDGFKGFVSLVVPLQVGGVDVVCALALPCALAADKSQMLIGQDGTMDPRELYIVAPKVKTGGLILAEDVSVGTSSDVKIVHGPPDAHFVLFESDRVGEKSAAFEGREDWSLDTSRQVEVGRGSLDAEGEATLKIAVPDESTLVGSFRAYQALIESEGLLLSTGPAVVKVMERRPSPGERKNE